MRKELRFVSNALVYVIDKSNTETEANLRDLSLGGLSIRSDSYIDIEPNSSCMVVIIPEKETNLKEFKLEIESKWIKLKKAQMESGFSILVGFDEKEYKEYLEYLHEKEKKALSEKEG